MRKPLEMLLPGLFSFLCLLSASAADLKTYSDVYQKNSAEIRQGCQPKFDDLQRQYLKSLESLKARAQSKGDFKTTKACMAEAERFQKARTLPPAPEENEIPDGTVTASVKLITSSAGPIDFDDVEVTFK